MKAMMFSTIVAPATKITEQAISIIRVSGEETFNFVNKMLKNKIKKIKNIIQYRWLYDYKGNKIDEVLIMTYVSPNSFTGEDMVEINCHGGVIVAQKIISELIKAGCKFADKGEFSKRAFLNNKINLVQAESINNLIHAKTPFIARTAINNLSKKVYENVELLRDKILSLIANIEVNIDYPEYDGLDPLKNIELNEWLKTIILKFQKIIFNSKKTLSLSDGLKTLIVGKPNVGKSSLLNAFLNEEKSIVSKMEGTTRDFVEGNINLNDITLKLIDTAGIRKDSNNEIENIGIKRTIKKMEEADLIILLLDGRKKIDKEDLDLINKCSKYNNIKVYNKSDEIDLNKRELDKCYISAKNNDIEQLEKRIIKKFKYNEIYDSNDFVLLKNTQIAELEKINNILKKIKIESEKGITLDILSIELKEVWLLIGELFGLTHNNDIIDAMFKNYCLGK